MSVTNILGRSKSTLTGIRPKRQNELSTENVERLSLQDVPNIISLQNEITDALFGDVNVHETVCESYLTLGVVHEGRLVGAVCLGDSPNIRAVPMWCWESWLQNLFKLNSITALNSKWIRFLAFDVEYTDSFLPAILKSIFIDKEDNLEYIAMPIPPGVKAASRLSEHMSRILPKGYGSPDIVTTIGLFARTDFVRRYVIRRAVEEDNDVVISIINRNSETFKQLYGSFYISELIKISKDNNRQIIVADYKNRAVAVLIVNSEIDYDTLNESFEISPYHAFKSIDEMDDLLFEDQLSQKHVASPADSVTDLFSFPLEEKLSVGVTCAPKSCEQSEDITVGSTPTQSETLSDEDNWTIDPSIDMSVIMAKKDENFFDISSCMQLTDDVSMLSVCLLNTDEGESTLNRLAKCYSLEELKLAKPATDFMKKMINIPHFYGRPKAFALEVLASEPDHASAIHLLLEAAFRCLKDRDYCIVCTPSIEPYSEFLRDFVSMTARDHSIFPHDLFILHRNTLNADMKVRLATLEDESYVLEFLSQMIKPTNIYQQFLDSVCEEDSYYISLIMTCHNQIVGMAVISELVDLDYLTAHYTMYKWIDEDNHCVEDAGAIEFFLIYPIFQKFCRFFLNQIHRLADLSILISFITHEDLEPQSKKKPLPNCIEYLVPVIPRYLPEYDAKFIEESYFPQEFITEERLPFSIYLSTPKLTGMKRIEIGTKIVVVGTGDTAMAFLETLVCGSGPGMLVTFNNITVISPHGLPYYRETSKVKNMFTVTRGQTHYHRILQMNLRIHVNVVHGVLSKINRDVKYIIVNEFTHVPYDFLVLFCGEQYVLPKLKKKKKKKVLDFPENAFVINTDSDVIQVVNKLAKLKLELSNKKYMGEDFVIVYGNDTRALACLASLVEQGIPPKYLMLIAPTSSQILTKDGYSYANMVISDPLIADAVYFLITSAGISLLKDFVISDWLINDENRVESVTVLSKMSTRRVGCKFIFFYTEKTVSIKTQHAINRAGLVFDGRLVIDSKFRTNDPFIFAAGSLTRYSRKYHTDHKNHSYFNSQEVGECIGHQFRKMLIPGAYKKLARKSEYVPQVETELPNFERPIIKSCAFPGGVFYLSVRAPGKKLPIEYLMGEDNYGRMLQTGDYQHLERQGYFRIHLDSLNVVQSFCCLSKEPIDVNNLIHIQGKHATLLNNLLVRFDNDVIDDLFEFFKEPCFMGIYYDKFSSLMKNVRQLLTSYEMDTDEFETTIPEIILRMCKDHNDLENLTDDDYMEIEQLMQDTNIIAEIEDNVLEYIQKNRIYFPMYGFPSLFKRILAGHRRRSPMFSK